MKKIIDFIKKPFRLLIICAIIASITLVTGAGIIFGLKNDFNPEVNMSNPSRVSEFVTLTSSIDSLNSAPNFSEKDGVINAKSANDANAFIKDNKGKQVWTDKYIFKTTMKMNDYALSQSAIKRAGIIAAYIDKDEYLIFFIDISGKDNKMSFAIDGPRNGGTGVGGWRFEATSTPEVDFNFLNEMEITVLKDTEDLYILVNDIFVYKKHKIYGLQGMAQPGFHNRMTDVTYTNYSVETDAAVVDEYVQSLNSNKTQYFGKHISDNIGEKAIIYNQDQDNFKLEKTDILRGGYYFRNKMLPLNQDSYIFEANVKFEDPSKGAAVQLHLTQALNDRLRFIFTLKESGLEISTDLSNGSNPTSFFYLANSQLKSDSTFDIKLIQRHNMFTLLINGELSYTVQKTMDNPQLGLFAANTGITLKNIKSEVDDNVVESDHLAVRGVMNYIPFARNTLGDTSSYNAEMITLDKSTNNYKISNKKSDENTTSDDFKTAYFTIKTAKSQALLSGTAVSFEGKINLNDIQDGGSVEFIVQHAEISGGVRVRLGTIRWIITKGETYIVTAVKNDSTEILEYEFTEANNDVKVVAHQNVYAFMIGSELVDELIMDSTTGEYNSNQIGLGVINAEIEVGDYVVNNNERYVRRIVGKARYQEKDLPFGKHHTKNIGADDLFVDMKDTTYEASSTAYSEQYYYQDGIALAGNKLMIKGVLELKSTQAWAQAIVELVQDENNRIRYVLERTDDRKYQLFTDNRIGSAFSGWTEIIKAGSATNLLEFTLIANNGKFLFAINNKVVNYKEVSISNFHVAFGIEKGDLNASKLRGTLDSESIDKEIMGMDNSGAFKTHAYITYGVANAITFDKANNSYKFDRTSWGDAYHYTAGAIPTAGQYWAISLDMDVTRAVGGKDIEIQAVQADNHKIRWVFQYSSSTRLRLFTDYRNKGSFAGWKEIITDQTLGYSNKIDIIHNNGTFVIVLNGKSVHTQTLDMPKAQIGFGSGNASFTLSNIDATVDTQDVIERYNAAIKITEETINPFKGADGKINNVFKHVSNNMFEIAKSTTYQESYVYGNANMANPLNGTVMLFKSQIVLEGDDTSLFNYRFVENGGKELKINIAIDAQNSHLLFSGTSNETGEEKPIEEFDTSVNLLYANVQVIVKNDVYYLVVNNALVGKFAATGLGNVSMRIGGTNVKAQVSQIISSTSVAVVDNAILAVEYVAAPYPFGRNKYVNVGVSNAFIDNKDHSSYTKNTAGFNETFYYEGGVDDGVAIAGDKVMLNFDIVFEPHSTGGLQQAVILLRGAGNKQIRFVFEKNAAGANVMFIDYNPGTGFKGYKSLYGSISGGNLTVIIDNANSKVYLYYNGGNQYLTTLTTANFGTDAPLSEPMHIGFGAENAKVTLSNLKGSIDAHEIDAEIARIKAITNLKPLDPK